MQSSNLNQTEIPEGQDSIRHSMSKVIHSFHDKRTHGPEYICSCCDQLWYKSDHLSQSVTVANIVVSVCKVCWRNV